LQICLNWYAAAVEYNNKPGHQDVTDFAGSAAKAAEQLLSLLERADIPPRLTSYPNFARPLSELLPALRNFHGAVKRLTIVRSHTPVASGIELDHLVDWLIYADHFRERSAFEWLAGVYLCELHELFIGPPSGRKFICFVETVLEVFDVKTPTGSRHSKEAISRARRLNKQLASTTSKMKARRQGPIVDADVPDQMSWLRHMEFEHAAGVGISGDFGRDRLDLLNKLGLKA
jgi:hypothetical protein